MKMNGHLDPYVQVSVPNGFHETVSSSSSVSDCDSLIDLSPSRCRAPSNPNPQDVVREGQTSAVAYHSASLLSNGVLFRNSSEAAATAGHLPVHCWSGKLLIANVFILLKLLTKYPLSATILYPFFIPLLKLTLCSTFPCNSLPAPKFILPSIPALISLPYPFSLRYPSSLFLFFPRHNPSHL